jgi:cellulose synthase/poly-beta-1,6-N-acetylglucosamine synthase-like glycosyltransferase
MASEPLGSATPGPTAPDTPGTPPRRDLHYEPLGLARSLLVLVYVAVAVWYLAWRPTIFNPQAPVFSGIVYAAELFSFVVALMHVFMVWRLSVRAAPAPAGGLRVDIFIPTYNEPLDMLRRTLLAALRMEYPHRTWLLDDGNRPEARALADTLGCRYLARERNTDAKAGNLNNALQHSDAELIAVFDADHAPAPEFLSRTLGYFTDSAVAFVQTPQDFYNLDSYQHRRHPRRHLVWTEQSLFFRVIQRGKDYWNAAFFCGSCAVLRRGALDEVGGFATGSVTEDLQTSIRLHRKGFASVYHAESLAFGIAPATVIPFLKQRLRWGQGAMQALRTAGIWFGHGLTLPQRVNYLATVLTYFDGWQKAVFYIAPAIVLLTGIMPISEVSWQFLAHFLPFYILTFWVFEEVGRGYGRSVTIEQYNMARFAAFVWATLALLRRKLDFTVTAKHRLEGERPYRWVGPQLAVLVMNAVAIPVGVFLWMGGGLPTGALVANVVWACVNLSLAQAVLRFTARLSRFTRREYRFPVPLPALLDFAGSGPVVGVLDDVSSHGFKFYGRFPGNAAVVGARVHGEINLPSSKLQIQAEVRSLIHAGSPGHHVKALGCRFRWDQESDRDELEGFLYGSNLQWRMNRLGERMRTPLEWMTGGAGWRKREPHGGLDHWAAVLSRSTAAAYSAPAVGLVSVPMSPSGDRTLVSYRRLADAAPLRLDVLTRSGMHTLEGPAYFLDTVSNAGTLLHFYRFEARQQRQAPWRPRP